MGRPTNAELTEEVRELSRICAILRHDFIAAQEKAELGQEMARIWLRDRPLSHRDGCACRFCLYSIKLLSGKLPG